MICMGAGVVTEEDGGCLVGSGFVENELNGRKKFKKGRKCDSGRGYAEGANTG
jgi:hypothetical protein